MRPVPTPTWAEAMQSSLHAPSGFYARGRGPDRDFRTAATAAPDLLADAVVALLGRLPPAARATVVDVGAGTGALLTALADRLPETELVGVEQRPRPPGLPARIGWTDDIPRDVRGLVLAFEWLDTVPVDVVVDGRVQRVGPDGGETAGGLPTARDRAWLERWWPVGERREVGHRRDDAWARAVSRLTAGVALAVDYGHRAGSRPASGSLTGYRDGRLVTPAPDGACDVTADVAFDALAAATGRPSVLTSQRAALLELGIDARLPARADPDQVAGLRRASRARVLLDPAGLGGFGWLATAVEVPVDVLPGRSTPGGDVTE